MLAVEQENKQASEITKTPSNQERQTKMVTTHFLLRTALLVACLLAATAQGQCFRQGRLRPCPTRSAENRTSDGLHSLFRVTTMETDSVSIRILTPINMSSHQLTCTLVQLRQISPSVSLTACSLTKSKILHHRKWKQ